MTDRFELLQLRKDAIYEARHDLIAFTSLMRPHPNDLDDPRLTTYDPQPHHRYVAGELEEVAAGKLKRVIFVLPPRAGKTELCTKHFVPWALGHDPSKHFIVGTYNNSYAADLGRGIRDVTVSAPYLQMWPNVTLRKDVRNVGRMLTQEGGGIGVVGRGSTLTGRGGDVIVIDDPIKDRAEANSLIIREGVWTWLTQVVMSRFMTDQASLILALTRWHEDDPVGRLTDPSNPHYHSREAKKWRVIHMPAIAEEGDILGRKVGQVLWPKRFGKRFLREMESLDPHGFSALYQGHPSIKSGSFFREDDIIPYTSRNDLPKNLRYYAASDHAVSLRQQNDFTCLGVIGVDEFDDLWLLPDLYWKKVSTNVAVDAMVFYIKRYHPVFWWAESGHITKSIGPFLRKRMAEDQAYCTIDDITPSADKQQRAQSIQGRMSMGRVHFPVFASWWPEAKRQLMAFPFAAHDDFVDFLSLFGMGLDRVRLGKGGAKRVADEPKVGTLAWVKWASNQRKRSHSRDRANAGW